MNETAFYQTIFQDTLMNVNKQPQQLPHTDDHCYPRMDT